MESRISLGTAKGGTAELDSYIGYRRSKGYSRIPVADFETYSPRIQQLYNLILHLEAVEIMPGKPNPMQISHILGQARRSLDRAREEASQKAQKARAWASEGKEEETVVPQTYVDLTVHFIGANGLPKMDVVGTADPYFVAKLDTALTFV